MANVLRFLFVALAVLGVALSIVLLAQRPWDGSTFWSTCVFWGACVFGVVVITRDFLSEPAGQKFLESRAYKLVLAPMGARIGRSAKTVAFIVLGLLALILIVIAAFMVFKGIAALPVSVAVILGAIIVATVLAKRE